MRFRMMLVAIALAPLAACPAVADEGAAPTRVDMAAAVRRLAFELDQAVLDLKMLRDRSCGIDYKDDRSVLVADSFMPPLKVGMKADGGWVSNVRAQADGSILADIQVVYPVTIAAGRRFLDSWATRRMRVRIFGLDHNQADERGVIKGAPPLAIVGRKSERIGSYIGPNYFVLQPIHGIVKIDPVLGRFIDGLSAKAKAKAKARAKARAKAKKKGKRR